MTDDATLALETALMYQNAFGFEPVLGNLTHWRGVVRDRSGRGVSLDINLPSNFPHTPPEFILPENTTHPVASTHGKVVTRSMRRWTVNSHIYQVLRDVRQAIASDDFGTATIVHNNVHDDSLARQIDILKDQKRQKEQELENLRSMPSTSTSTFNHKDVAEESMLNIESEIYSLEDAYDRLEVDDVEFARKFYDLRKRYYMIEASIR